MSPLKSERLVPGRECVSLPAEYSRMTPHRQDQEVPPIHFSSARKMAPSMRRRIGRNRNWYVRRHLPSLRRLDPDQDHHERLWNQILATVGYSDADRRVHLCDIGFDENDFFLFVARIDP